MPAIQLTKIIFLSEFDTRYKIQEKNLDEYKKQYENNLELFEKTTTKKKSQKKTKKKFCSLKLIYSTTMLVW